MNKFRMKKTARGFSPQSLWLVLCMLFVGAGAAWADDVVKNTTQDITYGSLQDAFYDANAGDVIELLGNVDATNDEAFSNDFCLGIEAGITLKGNGHTLTVNRRGLSVARQSSNARMRGAAAKAPANTINVSIENLTIKNVAAQVKGKGGQLINTRGGIGTLTLSNVTFDTKDTQYNKDIRPLVIGGNQSTKATVVIDGCKFTATTAPSGYTSVAINVLNPVDMSIKGTTIDAQYAINLGGADESYGSQGSVMTLDGSTVTTTAGAAVLFDFDDLGTGANGSTVTLSGETKITTPTAEWYALNGTENTIVSEHFATNYINATKYETKPTIQIGTVDELLALATTCNTATEAAKTAGNTYELTADLDLTGVEWTPAGGLDAYPSTAFKGTFDGMGHTISNLTCTDTHANHATAALFGATSGYAIIKNLTLKDVNITSTHYAAGFVAYEGSESNYTTIENCHVIGGSIVSTPELVDGNYDNGDKVGGIVGYSVRTDIKNCSVEGVTMQAYRDLGGLAGFLQNSGAVIEGNTVKEVTLTQSDENGYKTNADGSLQDMSYTVGYVVGGRSGADVLAQANDETKNTSENVTVTESAGFVAKIGDAKFATLSAAIAAATEGQTVEIYVADTYTLPAISKNITVKGAVEGVVFKHTTAGNIASVSNGATFENVTFDFGKVNYHGFQHAGAITMKNCVLNGLLFSYADMVFEGCTFNAPGVEASGIDSKDYSMWAYSGNLTYDGCTFNYAGKCVNVYNEDGTKPWKIIVKDCTFNSTVANKAAFNVKATCGTKPLNFEVTLEGENKAIGTTTNAETAGASNFINEFVQVDDVNEAVTTSNIDIVEVDSENNETVLYTSRAAEYNGQRYLTLQEALDAAEAADDVNMVINLLNDATLDIEARANILSIGTANTETITINGNNHTLTFNQKDSDWNDVSTANDAKTKLILNDMNVNNSGKNSGHWKRTNIFFSCAVEMNNVTATALGFKNDATLKNVTVDDSRNDVYAIWVMTDGQDINIEGLTVDTPNGRGIAIKDEDSDKKDNTTLAITDATFTTAKKAAILVTSPYTVAINASNLNIENVKADNVNAVWVDEKNVNQYSDVTLTGDATMIPEGGVDAYTVVRTTGETVNGYYTDLAKAIAEAEDGQTVTLKADFNLGSASLNINKGITVEADGHSITSTAAKAVFVTGTGDVTINNANITTTGSKGILLGEAEATAYSGKFTLTNSTVTSAQRGVDAFYVTNDFDLVIDNSTIQANVSDPTTTYSTDDARGLNLIRRTDDGDFNVTLNNTVIQGFSYDVNMPSSGTDINFTMTGGKSYGRAVLNNWGSNNTFTLDGVEVHGLNNQTGTQEGFACVVENSGAQNNVYNINNVTFIANLSEAAYTTATSTASEQMLLLQGKSAVINITGNTTYTINEEAADRGGLLFSESALNNNNVLLDATAKESLASVLADLELSDVNATPDENGMYSVDFAAEVQIVYPVGEKYYGVYVKDINDAFTHEKFGANTQITMLRDAKLTKDIDVALNENESFILFLNGHTIDKGEYSISLPVRVTAIATAETDVFSAASEDTRAKVDVKVEDGDYYYTSSIHEVYYESGEESVYCLFDELFSRTDLYTLADGEKITLLDNVTLNSDLTLPLESGELTLTQGEYTLSANGHTIALNNGVTVTTDSEVELFVAATEGSFINKSSADGKYSYAAQAQGEGGVYAFVDGDAGYTKDADEEVNKVTYTRSYAENRTNRFQAWFLPFDYTIKAEDLEKFVFYKANMIALYEGEMKFFMSEMAEGDVLHANMPYIYKPLEVIDSYEFVSENVTLKAKNTGALLKMETTEATYTFFGTYATTGLEPSEEHTDYYINVSGSFSKPATKTVNVGPYRWYLRCEDKTGFAYARPFTFVVDEGNESTGLRSIAVDGGDDVYYTLNGVRVKAPGRGVYIRKSAGGVIQKVYLK